MTQAAYAQPIFASLALAGVRRRRTFALLIDLVIVGTLSALLWVSLLILTLGLSWFILPPLFPLVAFFYNGLMISSAGMGTVGMRAMGIEMRMRDTGGRTPFINAAVQVLLYYLSWGFPLIFLVTLVDSEKRFLHDILSGVVIVRRL
jgi:uncharacterized RDD family membrane protein YckC